MEWISTKERPPKKNSDVLLCEDNYDIHIGMLFRAGNGRDMYVLESGEYLELDEVIYWMKILEPPKQ